MVLVDSNVLLDLIQEDADWADWSSEQIECYADTDELAINPIILAEVSVAFSSVREVDEALGDLVLKRRNLPWKAAFLAGKAFMAYRLRGGPRRSPMPDFYIGAHAQVENCRLLTRDVTRYRSYFPEIVLICP